MYTPIGEAVTPRPSYWRRDCRGHVMGGERRPPVALPPVPKELLLLLPRPVVEEPRDE